MTAEKNTLRDVISGAARRLDRRVFLEHSGGKVSFAELDEKTDRVATGLDRMGLRPGDRVALLLPNRPELVHFLLGTAKLGMVTVPVDPTFSHQEILFVLQHSGASAIITEKKLLTVCRRVGSIRHRVAVDDPTFADGPFQGLSRGSMLSFWPDLNAEDPSTIAYCRRVASGPRAIVLSHRNLVSNTLQLIQPFRIDETDRFFCALPLSSTSTLVLMVLTALVAGATCILREAYSRHILRDLRETGATVFAGVPPLYEKIAGSREFSKRDFSTLRLAICNSGPVGEEVVAQFEDQHDALLVEGYGVPEATCLSCANPYTGIRKPGSLGLPLPGQECRIVDEEGREASPGEIGEILIRGPNVMKGYYEDPATTERVVREGWLHTGDFGFVDPDGYYHLAAAGL